MSIEAPRRFPSDVYDFLTTPGLKIEAQSRPWRDGVQHSVRLTRVVEYDFEGKPRRVSESIYAYEDTLQALDDTLFLGVREVEKGSAIETANQNFLSAKAALKKASLPK